MTDLLALSVFGVDWQFLKPFIVFGLASGASTRSPASGWSCCTGRRAS